MSSAVIANEHRKARRKHRCCECRAHILPGQTYWHYFGTTDGASHSHKTCDLCEQLRDDVLASWDPQDAIEGFEFRRLGEYCHEDPDMLPRWKAIWNRSVEQGTAKRLIL